MTSYTITRCCVTGANEYRFFCGRELLGTASALVLPDWPVVLETAGLRLRFVRDPEMTLIPGASCPLLRDDSGEEVGRVVWDGVGKHHLRTSFSTCAAERQGETFTLFLDGVRVGTLRRGDCAPGEGSVLAPDEEVWMAMDAESAIPGSLALPMLSVPLLQIGP